MAAPTVLQSPEQAAGVAQWLMRLGRIWFFAAVQHRRPIPGAAPAEQLAQSGVSHELTIHRLRSEPASAEPPFHFGPLVLRLGLQRLQDPEAAIALSSVVNELLHGGIDPYSHPRTWVEWFAKSSGVDAYLRRENAAGALR